MLWHNLVSFNTSDYSWWCPCLRLHSNLFLGPPLSHTPRTFFARPYFHDQKSSHCASGLCRPTSENTHASCLSFSSRRKWVLTMYCALHRPPRPMNLTNDYALSHSMPTTGNPYSTKQWVPALRLTSALAGQSPTTGYMERREATPLKSPLLQ